MRVGEYRACCGAELMATAFGVALVQVTGRNLDFADLALAVCAFPRGFIRLEPGDVIGTALQAADAFGPAERFQVVDALIFRAERLLDVYQRESVSCHN